MVYYEFEVAGPLSNELIIGWLSQWPFESFMENGEHCVSAYLPAKDYDLSFQNEVSETLEKHGVTTIEIRMK